MTRAESHLVFAAGESPNTFIEEPPVDLEELEPDVQDDDIDETTQAHLQIAVPAPDGPVGHSPHTLMRDDVFEDVDDGRGQRSERGLTSSLSGTSWKRMSSPRTTMNVTSSRS